MGGSLRTVRQGNLSPGYRRFSLARWTIALYAGWSMMVGLLLAWNLLQVSEYVEEQAHREIRTTLAKGRALSDWARAHGGVYVPVSDNQQPNGLLSRLPERDVTTPTGRVLTLVNPATLLNNYYQTVGNPNEVKGRLVNISPLSPDNRADTWETRVLQQLANPRQRGNINGFSEVTSLEGRTVLRLLQPRYFDDSCLGCHASTGARPGDIAGAISLSVPLDTEYANAEYRMLSLGYGTLWLVGLAGIRGGSRQLAARIGQRDAAHRSLAVQEQRISAIVAGSLDAIVTADEQGVITDWNPQAQALFGWKRKEVAQKPLQELLLEPNRESAQLKLSEAVGGRVECIAVNRAGHSFPVEISIAPLHGEGPAFAAFIRDITERNRAQDKIRRDYVSQQVIASVLELSVEPIPFREKLERTLDLILSTPWLSIQSKGVIFVADDDGALRLTAERGLSDTVRQGCAQVALGQCLCGRAAEQRQPIFVDHIDERHDHVFPDMQPHGHYCMPLLSGDRLLGVLTLYVKHGHRGTEEEQQFLSAISHTLGGMIQRHRAEEELRYSAFYDDLTGLPNRALLMDRVGHALARIQRREDDAFSMLYLDLDRFKNINDSLGHAAGDAVLVAIAERLRSCVRPGDTVARLGGDEFTVLLDDMAEAEQTLAVANRIHATMQRPLHAEGHEVFTSVSIGVALARSGHQTVADIMREADTAMYQAKRIGTAQTAIFDQAMHHRAVALLKLETELRRAVEKDEFVTYYQPILYTDTGRLLGFEALVRWIHPERGMVSPAEFIPVAEETGLINSIGRKVLHDACRQMQAWHRLVAEGEKPYVSVNLSAAQFLQPDLLQQVDQALAESALAGCHLCLEVTESILIDQTVMTRTTLAALRERGVRLAIDDFGTGYSSLSYLHAFPFDALKIDRTFTANLAEGAEHQGIVQSVMAIARHLGMSVIAEGVEKREQLEVLRHLGCENVQGFYFSPPVSASAAAEWLFSNSNRLETAAPA